MIRPGGTLAREGKEEGRIYNKPQFLDWIKGHICLLDKQFAPWWSTCQILDFSRDMVLVGPRDDLQGQRVQPKGTGKPGRHCDKSINLK